MKDLLWLSFAATLTLGAPRAFASNELIFTDKGFGEAGGCVASAADIALPVLRDEVLEIVDGSLKKLKVGATDVDMVGSLWKIADDGNEATFACGGREFVSFDVFAPGTGEVVARVGVPNTANTLLFRNTSAYPIAEAQKIFGSAAMTADATAEDVIPDVLSEVTEIASSPDAYVVCVKARSLAVRDSRLRKVLFTADRNVELKPLQSLSSRALTKVVGGKRHAYIKVSFPKRPAGRNVGYVAADYIKRFSVCNPGAAAAAAKPAAEQVPLPRPRPVPSQPAAPAAPVASGDIAALLAPNCAKAKILVGAKTVVAKTYRNRTRLGGKCALGVRQSLQKSDVGDINGGIGHAIDLARSLKDHGYVDIGSKDPNTAPPGAVIVLSGPKTSRYFRNGKIGRPAGDYVGHVVIKGDDGWYYTDGRTKEVAIGWSKGRNVSRVRNVYSILVPGHDVVNKFKDQCHGLALK